MKVADKPKELPNDQAAPAKADTKKKAGNAPDYSVLHAWYKSAEDAGRKQRWEWFVIDQFLRGNHSIRGNPNDNTIEVSRNSEQINYPINKIFATFRAVRGFVTRNKPMIEVDPEDSTDPAKAYARRANKILERDNQLNNYRKINKEWVYYGVKYGIGYRQIGYDQKKKCCIRWSVDPFDLRIVGNGEMEDAPAIIKDVVRTIDYLNHRFPNPLDGDITIAADNELAADEYKKLSMQIVQGMGTTASKTNEHATKIVHECWYRVYEPNKAGGTINKVTFISEGRLDFEETPLTEYPFIPYKSDIVPNEQTGEGHLKHIVAPQRMINLLNTQMLEYNHLVNRGRFMKEKNAGFKVITSKEGQIIEHNPGKRVEVLNPPAINPMLERQLNMALQFIQDLGGQQDASMGKLPSATISGDAIEALQQGDSNNIADLRDNFEDALALEAEWILKMYSLFEGDGIVMTHQVKDQEQEKFAVVGQQALAKTKRKLPKNPATGEQSYFDEDNGGYLDYCAVLPENHVKVTVTSQLGETRQARLNLLMQLVPLGLPFKFLLEYLEFPNTTDIFERITQEALGGIALNQMQQPPQPGMPPGAMPPGGPGGPPPGMPPSGAPPMPQQGPPPPPGPEQQ